MRYNTSSWHLATTVHPWAHALKYYMRFLLATISMTTNSSSTAATTTINKSVTTYYYCYTTAPAIACCHMLPLWEHLSALEIRETKPSWCRISFNKGLASNRAWPNSYCIGHKLSLKCWNQKFQTAKNNVGGFRWDNMIDIFALCELIEEVHDNLLKVIAADWQTLRLFRRQLFQLPVFRLEILLEQTARNLIFRIKNNLLQPTSPEQNNPRHKSA